MLKKLKKKDTQISKDKIFGFIQDRAYRLWDEAGRPKGRDWEFWFKAEKEVKRRLR